MEFEALAIPGSWLVQFQRILDDRGEFQEALVTGNLPSSLSQPFSLAQMNLSISHQGVLRGIHSRRRFPGEAKYVMCVSGTIFDVVVDLRPESPFFGSWVGIELRALSGQAILLDAGLGHGFLATSGPASILYATSARYDPQKDFEVNALDPALGIEWPITQNLLRSPRDERAPTLNEVLSASDSPLNVSSAHDD